MQSTLLVITTVLLVVSCVQPPYPVEQLLQHVPTVPALVVLAVAARRRWLSNAAFACFVGFLWLHILGARYIYSFVPYDDWTAAWFGNSISDRIGWQRNHYDRLVHLCFGGLFVLPITEAARRSGRLTLRWAITFAVCAVMTISALYEVFEWLLAVFMSPAHAEAYNGQQGDFWDAQKDMALALAGSLAVVPVVLVFWQRPGSAQQPAP